MIKLHLLIYTLIKYIAVVIFIITNLLPLISRYHPRKIVNVCVLLFLIKYSLEIKGYYKTIYSIKIKLT